MAQQRFVTASQLAALCQVDLKTIHNWADRGKIEHFRTPGRHLRFHQSDVDAFLVKHGYTKQSAPQAQETEQQNAAA